MTTITPQQIIERINSVTEKSPALAEYINGLRTIVRNYRVAAGLDNYHVQTTFHPNPTKMENICDQLKELGYQRIASSKYFYSWIKGLDLDVPICSVNFDPDQSQYTFLAIGDEEECKTVYKIFQDNLPQVDNKFTKFYLNGNDISTTSVEVDVSDSNRALPVFYPWLDKTGFTLDEFISDYLKSKETILMLLGAAGTGKTTLIREIIRQSNPDTKIGLTSDPLLMAKAPTTIMNEITEGSINLMIFEDSDILIQYDRKNGNPFVSTILNTSDGLEKTESNNVKIIFTSNLTSKDSIDSALLRSGRCYGIVRFTEYSPEYALKVAEVIKPEFELTEGKKSYSLADISHFSKHRLTEDGAVRKFGF